VKPTIQGAVDRAYKLFGPFPNNCTLYYCSVFRFVDTILSLRQWKSHLPATKDTRLGQWLHLTFQRITSLTPIYFDRIRAFSGPLYGFDATSLPRNGKTVDQAHDWNIHILDWLRRLEKAGAPPTCVAIVLDAFQTDNLHVERGIHLVTSKKPMTNVAADGDGDQRGEIMEKDRGVRIRWPAVYMRSTMRLVSPNAAQQPRKSSASSLGGSSTNLNASSQSNLLPWGISTGGGASGSASQLHRASNDSGTTTMSSRSPQSSSIRKTTTSNILLEYGPDTGAARSWPHAEWDDLVALLDLKAVARSSANFQPIRGNATGEEVAAITYREREEDPKTWSARDSLEGAASLFSASSSSFDGSSSITSTRERKGTSVFHIIPINDVMSLVVIVKEVESRWNRRRSATVNDEEVRSFLTKTAKNLRVDRSFSPSSIPATSKECKIVLEDCFGDNKENADAAARVWSDASVQILLKLVKESFGLRPVSPFHHDSLRSYMSTLSPMSRRRVRQQQQLNLATPSAAVSRQNARRRQLRKQGPVPIDDSATAFFLGDDLARLF